MTISAGVSAKGSATGVSSKVTNSVTTQASGSTFVVDLELDFSITFTSLVDSFGNTYTLVDTETVFNTNGGRYRRYICQNGVGGASHNWTVTVSAASDIGICAQEWIGAAAASLDVHGQRNDTATPFTLAAGLTPSQANVGLQVFLAGNSGSNPATLAESGIGSMTLQQQETNGAGFWPWGMYTKVVSSIAAYNPSVTQSGGTNCAISLVAIKEAAAATTWGPLLGQQNNRLIIAT